MPERDVERTVRSKRIQSAVRFFAVARMTIGATFMLAPDFSSRRLLAGHRTSGPARTFGRMAAGRDLALGTGTLLANWSETHSEFEWLVAGLIADSIDFYAFIKDDACRVIPRVLSGLVAGGAVVLGLWTILNADALRERTILSDGEETS